MLKSPALRYLLLVLILASIATACNGTGGVGDAPTAVEGYFRALVDKDENKMINHSCAAWEAQAKQELIAFAAVELTLEDLTCKQAGQENDTILVSCSGAMIANYGAEILQIDVAERNYRVVQERGEWRMCGYQ